MEEKEIHVVSTKVHQVHIINCMNTNSDSINKDMMLDPSKKELKLDVERVSSARVEARLTKGLSIVTGPLRHKRLPREMTSVMRCGPSSKRSISQKRAPKVYAPWSGPSPPQAWGQCHSHQG